MKILFLSNLFLLRNLESANMTVSIIEMFSITLQTKLSLSLCIVFIDCEFGYELWAPHFIITSTSQIILNFLKEE